MNLGRHYLRHPDAYAIVNGVIEHPPGRATGDFQAHMRNWCSRVLGAAKVPELYLHLERVLTRMGNAVIVFTPTNDTVRMQITTPKGERFNAPVFYIHDDADWFDVGVRMACHVAVNAEKYP